MSIKEPCLFDFNEAYFSSGTFISSTKTVVAPVPHYGYLTSTKTVSAGQQMDFFVRRSTSVTGVFDSWVATTDYLLLSSSDTAWQYKTNLYTSSPTAPSLSAAGLLWKSTGYWEKSEQYIGGIENWGQFLAQETTQAQNHWTYQMKSSTYSGGTASASYGTVTSAANITIATGSWVMLRATSLFSSATETVRLNSLSYNYDFTNAGLSSAFEYLGNVYFALPYDYSITNNRLLKLDLQNNGWQVFDIPMNSPMAHENHVYFGSTTGGYVYQYPYGSDDDGSAINSYWKSKDYIGSNPYVEKNFDRLSIIAGSDVGSTLDVVYTMNTSTSTSFSIDLSSSTQQFVRYNRQLPIGETGTFFNLKVGNNAASQPWTFYGASIDYNDDPWRVIP